MEQKIIFDEDKCYVETPIYPDSVKRELVMSKEIFIECYNKWIKKIEDGTIHAEWLGIDYDGYADGQPVIELWECSHCGYEHKGDYTTLTDYCPNYGAKMESEDNK